MELLYLEYIDKDTETMKYWGEIKMLFSIYDWTDTLWVIIGPLIFLILLTGVISYVRQNYQKRVN